MGIAPGTTNTLTATLNDAKGATGGAVVFTMINAVFENADTTAQHAQFGTVTGTWQAFSSDGVTNPSVVYAGLTESFVPVLSPWHCDAMAVTGTRTPRTKDQGLWTEEPAIPTP